MKKYNLIAKSSIFIHNSIEQVWFALTDKDMIRQYFFGTETITDWKEGNPILFRGTWGDLKYEDKGTILKVEPNHLIKYSYWSNLSGIADSPENYQDITYEIIPQGGGTLVVVTQDNVESEEKKKHYEQDMWSVVLNGLKGLLEK
jgi:uncharacterized protein YndB with AHSA1/START domain